MTLFVGDYRCPHRRLWRHPRRNCEVAEATSSSYIDLPGASSLRFFLVLLGRHARWALPAGVFAGIVLPDLASLLRPLLTPAVMGTLAAALLRLDWSHLAVHARQPGFAAALCAWQLVASPLMVWLVVRALDLAPELQLALTLQAAAPPMGSAAAFALILGLDGALAAFGTVVSTLLLPATLTPLVVLLPETVLKIDLAEFFVRVLLVVGAPFALADVMKRLLGAGSLARNHELLGGLNVLLLVIFAIGVMDGVTARLASDPGFVGALLGAACVTTALLHLAAYVLFRGIGARGALGAAVLSGNRNMGLMLAITAGTAGETFSLYVGIAQIPMYFAPLLLTPFVRRRMAAHSDAR
jgi:bile acid:Na+ symporter, BASS family